MTGSYARFARMTVLAALCFLTAGVATARDPAAGKIRAQQACATCHGLYGKAQTPMTPNLAGQVPEYMAYQIRNYKSGKRAHEVMSVIAKSLSEEDIENVVAWYTSIKVTVEEPK
ncbi:MAG: c-type cytochrome [Burkholderiaceae bacterium]